jgi:prophage maintenance system killer protein
MITLDVPGLVLIASAALGTTTGDALGQLDVAAAEAALAEAQPAAEHAADPATAAATLLSALTRHRPFRRENDLIATAAALQFLSVNGWQADLDPPEAARAAIGGLAAGEVTVADLAGWLSRRLTLRPPLPTQTKETPMRRWLPGRKQAHASSPFGRLTSRARQVVVAAQDEARALGHGYIGTEHVLLGLLSDGDGDDTRASDAEAVAARALASLGISREAVRQQVLDIVGQGHGSVSGHIPFTPRAKKVLELSLREAMSLNHLYVAPEHILLGLIREGDGLAAQVLIILGADLDSARHAVYGLLDERGQTEGPPAAMAGAGTASQQLESLRREVTRLRDLLIQHGVEPDDGSQKTA